MHGKLPNECGIMKRINKVIQWSIARDNHCFPKFYVIGGSDIYGFKSIAGSDVDVRGFHMAPKNNFLLLGRVKEQGI